MKKIFAIALALVMVLSMASAFAYMDCDVKNYGWDCPTTIADCGKAKIDVVPYVKVPVACAPYFEMQPSECAAAVAGESIWVAFVLTVDANPNEAWFDEAEFKIDYTSINEADFVMADADAGIYFADNEAADVDVSEVQTYYLNSSATAWVEFDAEDDEKPHVFELDLGTNDPSKAKVCATYTSEFEALKAQGVELDGYEVWTNLTAGTDGLNGAIQVVKGDSSVYYTVEDGVVTKVEKMGKADTDFVNKVNATFGLGCGFVCVTAEAVQKNFGWDDKVEDCFKWGKASAIVDAECVVAIPKTGDASVLAWLF